MHWVILKAVDYELLGFEAEYYYSIINDAAIASVVSS
jgi:hypothetical protein